MGTATRMLLALIVITGLAILMDQFISRYSAGSWNQLAPRNVGILQANGDGVMISWTTKAEAGSYSVRYDTISHDGDFVRYAFKATEVVVFPVAGETLAAGKSSVPQHFYYQVNIRELLPHTRYYFVVVSNGTQSREFAFFYQP